jgi:hypothetical protein
LPRTKTFSEKYGKPDEDPRIASLPREVATAVRAMNPEDQISYLDSLTKTEAMIENGETFTPDISPTKRRPGRKPAANPGARTKLHIAGADPSLPLPELRQQEQEIIAQRSREAMEALEAELGDFPEDDDDAAIQFGRLYAAQDAAQQGDDQSAPKALSPAEREAAEQAARDAELAAFAERAGVNVTNVLAGPFPAVQTRTSGDMESPETYTVERVPCELRVLDVGRDYELEVKFGDGSWETVAGPHREPTGASAVMALRRIRPVDFEAFGLALAKLPAPHPARYFRVTYGAGERTPKTQAERDAFNREVRERMIEQRRSIAMRRGNREDDQVEPAIICGGLV